MAKKYKYIPLEEKTYERFKTIKKLIEVERLIKEGTISDFINHLLDLLKPTRLPNRQFYKT